MSSNCSKYSVALSISNPENEVFSGIFFFSFAFSINLSRYSLSFCWYDMFTRCVIYLIPPLILPTCTSDSFLLYSIYRKSNITYSRTLVFKFCRIRGRNAFFIYNLSNNRLIALYSENLNILQIFHQ